MYIKLYFKVDRHRFNFLSINLVKLHNILSISGLTTIKSLFSRETETANVPNRFEFHHVLLNDETMH